MKPEPWTPEWKSAVLSELSSEWVQCRKCENLCDLREHVVLGDGNPGADVMLIGEAPGEDEDSTGIPFVGRSGQLLEMLLSSIGVTRDDYYVTNLIKCRPPDNRDPTLIEKNQCFEYLRTEIYVVDPLIIVPVGRQATEFLIRDKSPITKVRGNVMSVQVPGKEVPLVYDAIPILHPAYLLRQEAPKDGKWNPEGDTAKTRADLKLIFDTASIIRDQYAKWRQYG